jgi:uncharacterized protein with HEPN domain
VSRSDVERRADILEAAEEIATLVRVDKSSWDDDRVRRLAVERLLEMIGEAARAMTEQSRALCPDIPWSDIIGIRTVLAHHYHRVDPDQV